MKFVLSIFLLFFANSALANVLFLNFNRNNTSLDITRSWAKEKSMKVLSFPNEIVSEINKDTLSLILNSLSTNNIKILVMSGHSGSETFSGKDGVLKREDLLNELTKHPEIRSSVKVVLARGCYSATIGDFFGDLAWNKVFPNLSFVAGHDGKAWSSETAQSQNFMKDFLNLQDDFIHAHDANNVLDLYYGFESHHETESSVWLRNENGEYFVSTIQNQKGEPLINFIEVEKNCRLIENNKKDLLNELQDYYLGQKEGYERPPLNHATGPLRNIYSWFLRNKHCYIIEAWQKDPLGEPKKIMALLFYERLIKNYSLNFNIYEFSQLLDWLNQKVYKNFRLPDLQSASRAEILEFSNQLNTLMANRYNVEGLENYLDSNELLLLNYFAKTYQALVARLDSQTIPFRWLTEEQSYDSPILLPSRPSHSRFNF